MQKTLFSTVHATILALVRFEKGNNPIPFHEAHLTLCLFPHFFITDSGTKSTHELALRVWSRFEFQFGKSPSA